MIHEWFWRTIRFIICIYNLDANTFFLKQIPSTNIAQTFKLL